MSEFEGLNQSLALKLAERSFRCKPYSGTESVHGFSVIGQALLPADIFFHELSIDEKDQGILFKNPLCKALQQRGYIQERSLKACRKPSGADSRAVFSAYHILPSPLRQAICKYHLDDRLIGHITIPPEQGFFSFSSKIRYWFSYGFHIQAAPFCFDSKSSAEAVLPVSSSVLLQKQQVRKILFRTTIRYRVSRSSGETLSGWGIFKRNTSSRNWRSWHRFATQE